MLAGALSGLSVALGGSFGAVAVFGHAFSLAR